MIHTLSTRDAHIVFTQNTHSEEELVKNGRLKFRILSDDIKVVEIDSKLSAAVGSAEAKEMKTLVLALMTSGGFNHQTLKTFVFVLVRTYPWLWDYLTEVRRRLDDRGEA